MKTKVILGSVLIAALLTGLAATIAPNDPKVTTREIMKLKLESSQKVLEGIATENYATVLANAQKLAALSQAAGWQARQTPAQEGGE